MTTDDKGIKHTDEQEHDELIEIMAGFIDNGKPKVGIFWYDIADNSLFGVEKTDADKAIFINGKATINKSPKDYWQKQHHRATAKGDTTSIFYTESNYTMIPCGRIFQNEADGKFQVYVGHWLNSIDLEKFREILEDEFNLPSDFEFVVDEHWDLGHGWSEEFFE
ncbi:MAG: hypothetical protein IKJ56_01205 [Bacteroidales bacterium]|nr:hypothetical protein [Bacteroidales bacterium]